MMIVVDHQPRCTADGGSPGDQAPECATPLLCLALALFLGAPLRVQKEKHRRSLSFRRAKNESCLDDDTRRGDGSLSLL